MRNRPGLWGTLALLIIVVVSSLPVGAQGADATVRPDVLNMRYGPGSQYDVVAELSRDTALSLLAIDNIADSLLWVYARRTSDGQEGWVAVDYLDLAPTVNLDVLPYRDAPSSTTDPNGGINTTTDQPTTDDAQTDSGDTPTGDVPTGDGIAGTIVAPVNFRTGPGSGYQVISVLNPNTSIIAKGRDGVIEWVLVNAGGQEGWVYYNYVALSSGYLSQLPVTNVVTTPSQTADVGSGDSGSDSASAAPAAVPPPVAGGAGLSGFGYGGHVDSFAYPDKMHYAGMTWAKRQIRYSRGAPGSVAAGAIDQAHANGFKVLLGIVGDANAVTDPSYFDDYARFVGEVAALGPDAIEVWNEMNIDREWANGHIDPALYTQLLAKSYNAIKGANPNVAVISGALSPTGAEGAFGTAAVWNDDRYLAGMAAAGAANYMDCIGAHYNEGVVSPHQTSGDPRSEYYTRYFWGMVNTYYNAFGGARPVCFTELGYVTPEGFGPLSGSFAWGANTSVAEQAAWLRDAVSLARGSGKVKLLIIWNVDFTHYGEDPMAGFAIIRPGGSCPACDALAGG